MENRSQIVGDVAGTILKPGADGEIAWGDHRIAYFERYCRDKTVLDIGCVHHNPKNYLSKYWVHKALQSIARRTVGIDLHEEGVRHLRAKGYDVRVADACDFDLAEKFDVIVAGDVIEHLDNTGGFLDCCFNHLTDDGVVLISTDNPWFFKHLARAVLFRRVKNNLEHVSWIDPVLLLQLAKRHNFIFDEDSVEYGAREWWITVLPLPRLLKYPTYIACLRKS